MMRIRPYTIRPAAFRLYDERFPDVAAAVCSLLREDRDDVAVEHIGSTAIPGCGGKGNIDFLMSYEGDTLRQAVTHLESHGFLRWNHPRAHPASRPVHVADVEHDNTWWPIHVHVIRSDDGEVNALRRFRDRLRVDPAAVTAYEADKRRIIERGVTFGPDYADAKAGFIQSVLTDRTH